MNMVKVGEFIAERRKQLNMTQQKLGEKLAVTDKAVSKWERGLSFPDVNLLGKLAFALECSIGEIMNGKLKNTSGSSNKSIDVPDDNDVISDDTVVIEPVFESTNVVSPYLFGNNLEHTRACLNSGISAQMLKNRKFVGKPGCVNKGCADFWTPLNDNTYLSFGDPYTRHHECYHMNRDHECNSQCLSNYTNGTTAGICQSSIYIQKDVQYKFAVIAKAYQNTKLTVRIFGDDKTVFEHVIDMTGGDFEEHSALFTSYALIPCATLEISFSEVGSVALGAVSLMPTNNFHGMRWDVIECLREMGTKVLRWPGGNFAGEYNWKDGLLPTDMRAPFESYLGIETQPHTMGYDYHEINTDDFVALCQEIGAEPFITINPAWNTPEESKQWVEYCNGDATTEYGKLRIDRGYEKPYNVQFWSLGNEFGFGHMEGDNTCFGYCNVAKEHGKKMLECSPNLTFCSSGPYPDKEWTEHSAKPLSDISPLVSLHVYMPYPKFLDVSKQKEEYEKSLSSVYSKSRARLRKMRNQLGDDNIKISFDEWNMWYAWYRPENVFDGIFTASMFHLLIGEAEKFGISLACHFEAVNEGAIMVKPHRAYLTPMGQMFSVMKNHINGELCFAHKECVVTRNSDIMTVTMLNRCYDKPKKFLLSNVGEIISSQLYTADRVTPVSSFTVVDNVSPEYEDGKYKYTLPCHSVMMVQIKINK